MAGYQVTVLGGDEIGLDKIGAQFDGTAIAFESMLRQVAAGAPVAEN